MNLRVCRPAVHFPLAFSQSLSVNSLGWRIRGLRANERETPYHTSLHCETRGGQKIKRLLPVYCSGSFHVQYMNVALQLVNWWPVALARFWHVCLEQNGRTWRSHVFCTMLLEKVLCLLPNVPEIKEKQTKCLNLLLTALFINTRILKFKSQMAFAFLAAVNHLSGPRSSLNFIRLLRVVIILLPQ